VRLSQQFGLVNCVGYESAVYEIQRSARLAGRGLARTPVFAVTAVLTLALVIGANGAVFAIVDRVFLRPLPFAEPDQLVYVTHSHETSSLQVGIPPIRLLDWSERNSRGRRASAEPDRRRRRQCARDRRRADPAMRASRIDPVRALRDE